MSCGCQQASHVFKATHLFAAGAGVGEAQSHDGAQPLVGVGCADVLRQQRKRRVVLVLLARIQAPWFGLNGGKQGGCLAGQSPCSSCSTGPCQMWCAELTPLLQ